MTSLNDRFAASKLTSTLPRPKPADRILSPWQSLVTFLTAQTLPGIVRAAQPHLPLMSVHARTYDRAPTNDPSSWFASAYSKNRIDPDQPVSGEQSLAVMIATQLEWPGTTTRGCSRLRTPLRVTQLFHRGSVANLASGAGGSLPSSRIRSRRGCFCASSKELRARIASSRALISSSRSIARRSSATASATVTILGDRPCAASDLREFPLIASCNTRI